LEVRARRCHGARTSGKTIIVGFRPRGCRRPLRHVQGSRPQHHGRCCRSRRPRRSSRQERPAATTHLGKPRRAGMREPPSASAASVVGLGPPLPPIRTARKGRHSWSSRRSRTRASERHQCSAEGGCGCVWEKQCGYVQGCVRGCVRWMRLCAKKTRVVAGLECFYIRLFLGSQILAIQLDPTAHTTPATGFQQGKWAGQSAPHRLRARH
jgi:hypothetical protein